MLVLTGGLKIFSIFHSFPGKMSFFWLFLLGWYKHTCIFSIKKKFAENGQKTPEFFRDKFFFSKKYGTNTSELKEKVFCKKGVHFACVQTLVFRKIKLRIAGIDRGVKNIFVFSFVSLEKKHFYHIFAGNGQKTPDFFETKFFFRKRHQNYKEKGFCKKGVHFACVQALVFRKIKLRIAGIDRGVKNIFDFSFVH